MEKYSDRKTINVGSSQEVTIKKLSTIIKNVVQYKGVIQFDTSKPDGMKRRVFDNSKIKKLGFRPKISLEEGIARAYQYFIKSTL